MRTFWFPLFLLIVLVLAGCVGPEAVRPIEHGDATPSPSASPTVTASPIPSPTATRSPDGGFLVRPGASSIRVMDFNVNWDSIFPDDDPQNHSYRDYNRVEEFQRVLHAIQPDIICMQEIHHIRSSQDLADMIEAILGTGDEWHVTSTRDNVIASRFGLLTDGYELQTGSFEPTLDQAAVLVDLPDDVYGEMDIYAICAHFKAAGTVADIRLRLRQADAIMGHIRDTITPGDYLDLPANTPFLLMGDFNIYDTDPALHVRILQRGDIYDEAKYGDDYFPDWDATILGDAMPSHNGWGIDFYTWQEADSFFNPGPLDRIFYTDSVLRIENSFVLNPSLLADRVLAQYGLELADGWLGGIPGNFDHLPLVVDFQIIQP